MTQLGGKVLTLSDFEGFILDPDGIHAGKRPWSVRCDVALPCATENELLGEDARALVANGCIGGVGGRQHADGGVHIFKQAPILFAPGKAANAGGVAVSGLEMSQDSARMSWKEAELQQLLKLEAARRTAAT